jgi:Zinc carboxypeptidase
MNNLCRLTTTAALLMAVAVFTSPAVSGQAGPGTPAPKRPAAARPATSPAGAPASVAAQDWAQAPTSERTFKVRLDFDRWHDVAELQADMKTLEKAYPKFLKYIVLGKSYDGRDIAGMVVNNPDTGPDTSKPAMYIEANIHGNEIQGGEICIYTIWYLMENYGKIDRITALVNERAFYIVPTVNPDGRDYFMHGPGGNARSGHMPVDDDNDYQFDEDQPTDLNGNGIIEQIRKYVPGQGNYKKSAADPRIMEPVKPGEVGDYILLGQEGLDRDGDGRVSEDGLGGYDPNRNFASDWQPNYIQSGAMDYPFELPEAKAVNDFWLAHPNIAGLQTYHNNGGMILRSPGAETAGEYPASDVRAYDELGRNAERMLPYYRYLVIWSGLYTVHGGVTDWANDGLGILSFSNELWNNGQYFTSPDLKQQQNDPNSPIAPRVANYFFNDFLEFGDELTDWKEFDHPQFGKVEIGGTFKKTFGRVPPRFMNEELCHRNMAWTLYQADEMPKVALGESKVEKLGDGIFRVWLDVSNPKVAPTILAKAAQNNVVQPDLLTVDGKGVEVLSASWVADKWRPAVAQTIDQKDLTRIMLRNGLAGRARKTIQYIIKGAGPITVKYASLKGGTVAKTLTLQ